ncbi:HD-GYP domain-containing protein [Silvimonas soli]|uniref:HD-GYP domain-containing protein n=1 Tax=Silvimonas soli TaxID=2980100 RepID=UPI0024B359B4|nr:HD domain-containing phosphohydrolase [Silvimonas soli]
MPAASSTHDTNSSPVSSASSVAGLVLHARFQLFEALQAEQPQADFSQRIADIAQLLQQACTQNEDVALAVILHAQEGGYGIRHAVDTALVVELVCRRLAMNVQDRQSVLSATLTMNIGMMALQETLSRQAGPLTPEQRTSMHQHPQIGRDLLRRYGVSDQLWLDCVLQHHELPDGSGYPAHLQGEQICFEARLIGLADRYCAMLTQAAWRSGSVVDSALFRTLRGHGGADAKLGRLFGDTLGLYPPGAVVRLANGEVGVVKRSSNEVAPLIAALFDPADQALPEPIERDSGDAQYAVADMLEPAVLIGRTRFEQVWGPAAAGL